MQCPLASLVPQQRINRLIVVSTNIIYYTIIISLKGKESHEENRGSSNSHWIEIVTIANAKKYLNILRNTQKYCKLYVIDLVGVIALKFKCRLL